MRLALAGLALSVLAGVLSYLIGDGVTDRMSSQRTIGLVAVPDRLRVPSPRPRRTVVVVADGLRRDAALGMQVVARLAAAGQCRATDVGSVSISRPVYATLSTGVEQDRTGVRDNSIHAPLAAESIWDVARHAGLVVVARSELTWFKELFPAGFDRYELIERADPYFLPGDLGDLALIHPVWVDEEAHDHGAASPEYAAAVARLDRELTPFLDGMDLTQDLIVLTADHGHTDRGGHGGRTPEVAVVETCWAGRGVAHRDGAGPMMTMAVAPALALLVGLPFPRHMRAGADGLDVLWEIADPSAFPEGYLADRHAAVARARAANPSWPERYERGRRMQGLALAGLVGLCAAMACAGRRTPGRMLAALAFLVLTVAAAVVVHQRVFGSFDLSAVNKRALYVRDCGRMLAAVAAAAFVLRLALARDLARATGDLASLVAAGLVVNLGLVAIFGAPLGFPLPTPRFLFLPIFAALFAIALSGVLFIASLVLLARSR